eukprot:gene12103-5595_t
MSTNTEKNCDFIKVVIDDTVQSDTEQSISKENVNKETATEENDNCVSPANYGYQDIEITLSENGINEIHLFNTKYVHVFHTQNIKKRHHGYLCLETMKVYHKDPFGKTPMKHYLTLFLVWISLTILMLISNWLFVIFVVFLETFSLVFMKPGRIIVQIFTLYSISSVFILILALFPFYQFQFKDEDITVFYKNSRGGKLFYRKYDHPAPDGVVKIEIEWYLSERKKSTVGLIQGFNYLLNNCEDWITALNSNSNSYIGISRETAFQCSKWVLGFTFVFYAFLLYWLFAGKYVYLIWIAIPWCIYFPLLLYYKGYLSYTPIPILFFAFFHVFFRFWAVNIVYK